MLGALLGASIAAANAMRGARTGFLLGSCIGPIGSAAGGITGAVVAGVCTGSVVSAIGGAIGTVADGEFLDDYECEACGHTFRRVDASSTTASADTTPESTGLVEPLVPAAVEPQGGNDGTRD